MEHVCESCTGACGKLKHTLSCPGAHGEGRTLNIIRAEYGRSNAQACSSEAVERCSYVPDQNPNLLKVTAASNPGVDVTISVRNACAGRATCTIAALNSDRFNYGSCNIGRASAGLLDVYYGNITASDPCVGTYKTLAVAYSCNS